ncbi:MAG: phosphoribosylglycinamide formyltransferase [Planctomycetota bacterium]
MGEQGPHARLACLISGGGRTALNLHEACLDRRLNAEIAIVLADRDCAGLARAREAGLDARLGVPESAQGVAELLGAQRIELVCLAGYLRLLPIPRGWEDRILNIHPALLPRFGGRGMHGLRVHRAVLDAGETESGCTVHLCDSRYDSGAIVLQRRCPVRPGDTPGILADRVFEEERIAYPEAVGITLKRVSTTEPRP